MNTTIVAIPAEDFKRLHTLLTWYDQAPNEYFGDSFSDTVDELITNLLPRFPEVDNDTHYISSQEPDQEAGVDLVRVFLFPVETDTNDHFTVEVVSE